MQDTSQLPPEFDPSDPVNQTVMAMQAQGILHPSAPAHAEIPPEGFIQTLMHNLVSNSTAWKDSGIAGRGLAALFDVLNAPHAAVQAALGVTPESQMQFSKDAANKIVAPSTSQMMTGPLGFQQFVQQYLSQGDTGRRWSPDTINMGLDIAGDPTSYLGLGIFKRLGAEAAARGAPRVVTGALKGAQVADEGASEAMGKVAESLIGLFQKGLIPVNTALAKQWPELVKWTEYYRTEQTMGQALQWLEHRGWDLPSLRANVAAANDITPVLDELPTALRNEIDPTHLQLVIEGIPKSTKARVTGFGQGGALRNPTDDSQVAFENYRRWLRNDMGLSDPKRFAKWYGEFNDWFKNQALGSLNYLVQNLQGGAAMGQMVGVDSPHTLAAALDNANNIARGTPFHIQGAEDLASKVDVPIPYALHEQADRALASRTGTNASANPMRDAIALGVLGGVGAGPAGALAGAAIGSRIGAVSERIRKSSQGIETVLRERGWEEGMSRALVKSMADMEKVIVDGLTKPGARASGTPVNQGFIDSLVGQVKDIDPLTGKYRGAGGQVDPAYIRRQLIKSVQITEDRAGEITRALDDILYNASQKGIDLSNKFNFDYQDLSAVERVLSEAFPFSTWFMKATPFFAEQGARHPLIGNIIRTERATAAQDQKERGLPPRFSGMLPNQTGSSLLSAIVGRPLEMFNDPLRGFIPFAGASQALTSQQFRADDSEINPIQSVLDTLDIAGLQPGPIPDMILRNSGLTGEPDDPARGYIRWGGPLAGATALASRGVEAATGKNPGWYVDVNRGTQRIEETVRKALTGQDVTVPLEVQTERRLDELALKNTGQPIGSEDAAVAPYVRARMSHSGPLWEQAKAEVELEKGVQSLAGFVSQDIQPQAILTPQEAQIRGAKKDTLIDPGTARALNQAATKSPTAIADPQHVAQVQSANDAVVQALGINTPPDIKERLANPTNANLAYVSKQIYEWEVEQRPLMRGYGSSGSPEQRQIGNAVSAMSHAGEGLDPLTYALMIQQNQASAMAQGRFNQMGAIHASHQIPGQEQAAIKADNPLVGEYFTWRTTHPGMGVPEFLAEKYHK
jgi:hypothetical protein